MSSTGPLYGEAVKRVMSCMKAGMKRREISGAVSATCAS